jgi:hypothetical protein
MATGYIVRSKFAPRSILCTNGEFIDEDFIGPGHKLGAKIYKRRSAAEEVLGGYVTVEEHPLRGNHKK